MPKRPALFALTLVLGSQVGINNRRFIVGGVAGEQPLLTPWPVQVVEL